MRIGLYVTVTATLILGILLIGYYTYNYAYNCQTTSHAIRKYRQKRLLAQLAKDNPKWLSKEALFDYEIGCGIDIELSRLGISMVSLSGPGIESIDSISGYSLKYFLLTDSTIKNLEPLRGMPLEWVGIVHCDQISDISSIIGAPIQMFFLLGIPSIDKIDVGELQLPSDTAIFVYEEDLHKLFNIPDNIIVEVHPKLIR